MFRLRLVSAVTISEMANQRPAVTCALPLCLKAGRGLVQAATKSRRIGSRSRLYETCVRNNNEYVAAVIRTERLEHVEPAAHGRVRSPPESDYDRQDAKMIRDTSGSEFE